MYEVKIIHRGKNPTQWIEQVRREIHPELQNQLLISAEATAEIMKRILEGSGYNLKRLANAIRVDVLNSTAGITIGIGKISEFPIGQQSGASYWRAFNEGFKVTQANIGYFGDSFRAPETGGSGQKWHHTGKGSEFFFMQPNKVIPPLRFVEIGHEDLVKHIQKEIMKFSGNLKKASK